MKNGRPVCGKKRRKEISRVVKFLSLTVGKKCGLPGTQRLVELLNEGQVVKVRENVYHAVIFKQVLEKEETHT